MPFEQHRYAETVGQTYNRMIEYVRANFDPRFVGGVASVPEIDRVKKAIVRLEAEAKEKARRESDNDPRTIATRAMGKLWRRGHEARQAIGAMQETRLGQKSSHSDTISWPSELKFFDLPAEFFETPLDIGRDSPSFRSLEEADTISSKLSVKVKALEELEAQMSGFLSGWEVAVEKQNRKMLWALLDRVQALEGRLK
jgi:hypothetical protein